MGRKAIVSIPQIQEINRLYDKGYTMAEIGKKLNIGHSTVNHYVWNPRHCGGSCKEIDNRRKRYGI